MPQLELFSTSPVSRKDAGAYYTPDHVVWSLVRWAVRSEADLMLDPACGDGRFISSHAHSIGVERDRQAAAVAKQRSPLSRVHSGDFFDWAAITSERFDCAAGNPPFIRYQTFSGEVRERAFRLSAKLGADFTGLTASWAPFLVVTASLLRLGGRMAFVVPAAIGHAPYAAPLLEYLIGNFATVQIVAVREKFFPELSEDCWLLYADGHGGATEEIRFSVVDWFALSAEPPRQAASVPVAEWRRTWNRRLRPYLLNDSIRRIYQSIAIRQDSRAFGDLATIGIGYVSGANRFFHLRPSEADFWRIPEDYLQPTVRNGKVLPDRELTVDTIRAWLRRDQPMMLLRVPKTAQLPRSVANYLATEQGRRARQAYKCRMRHPWYSVPDVKVPDFFLTYMSGRAPSLVRNSASATCTNALHAVRVHREGDVDLILRRWSSPFVRLSCELEGHPLGGGMLKLEPREAARIVLPCTEKISTDALIEIDEGASVMRAWRHYPMERWN
ncbi:MAG: N-6 DNA methylase [Spirochaetaceae bacterium]|nr:N-6 DNA methylase [Spirochaetaceae bacterium]